MAVARTVDKHLPPTFRVSRVSCSKQPPLTHSSPFPLPYDAHSNRRRSPISYKGPRRTRSQEWQSRVRLCFSQSEDFLADDGYCRHYTRAFVREQLEKKFDVPSGSLKKRKRVINEAIAAAMANDEGGAAEADASPDADVEVKTKGKAKKEANEAEEVSFGRSHKPRGFNLRLTQRRTTTLNPLARRRRKSERQRERYVSFTTIIVTLTHLVHVCSHFQLQTPKQNEQIRIPMPSFPWSEYVPIYLFP